jgi:hypothetical protein
MITRDSAYFTKIHFNIYYLIIWHPTPTPTNSKDFWIFGLSPLNLGPSSKNVPGPGTVYPVTVSYQGQVIGLAALLDYCTSNAAMALGAARLSLRIATTASRCRGGLGHV